MSLPAHFISCFSQSAPEPQKYTDKDVVDDFVKFIMEKTASSPSGKDVVINYLITDKFKYSYTSHKFFSLLQDVLMNQMNFSIYTKPICFAEDLQNMKSKSFYFTKTKVSYQYNEAYVRQVFCELTDNPDCIVVKLYMAPK